MADDPYAAFSSAATDPYASVASPVQAKRYGSGKSYDTTANGLVPSDQMRYGPESTSDQFMQAGKNVLEGGAKLVSGIGASVAGDVAGLGGIITNQIPGAPRVDPALLRQAIQSKYTYQPSDGNSLTQKIVDAPGRVIGGAGEYLNEKVTNATGNPYLGDVAGALPLAAASYLGVRAPGPAIARGSNDVALLPPQRLPATPVAEDAAIAQARQAGIKLTPTQTGAPIGSLLEGISGQAALERSLSKGNAPTVNRLAGQEIGLQPNAPLTPETIAPLKKQANAVYNEMSGLGKVTTSDAYAAAIDKASGRSNGSFPLDSDPRLQKLAEAYKVPEFDAADAIQKTRQLRADATKNIKAPNAPEQNALGYAQRAVSDALESELQRHAESLGQGDLVDRFKGARQQLAKIHSVEDALSPRGNISAANLAKQLDRGVPLSGNLKVIAETAKSFGKSVQDVEKMRHPGPFSVLDFAAGSASAFSFHNPALFAAVVSRPLIRSALRSDLYQNSLMPKPFKPGFPVPFITQ